MSLRFEISPGLLQDHVGAKLRLAFPPNHCAVPFLVDLFEGTLQGGEILVDYSPDHGPWPGVKVHPGQRGPGGEQDIQGARV